MPARIDPETRQFRRLLARGSEVRQARGDLLYRESDPADSLYAVLAGRIRLCLSSSSGREITVETVGPAEVFGEECLVPSGKRLNSARAAEATTVVRIAADTALRVLRSSRDFERTLIRAWLLDLREARRRAAERSFATVRQRLARLVLDLGSRFGRRESKGSGTLLPHRFTHQELADLIGGHRSTVTTTLGDWLYAGIVKERDHHLVIADEAHLAIQAGLAGR